MCVCVCVCVYLCVLSNSVVSVSLSPHNCSRPDSFIHEIFQERALEWVAISSSMGSSWPRDQTQIFCVFYISGRFFICWAIEEAPYSTSCISMNKNILLNDYAFMNIVQVQYFPEETHCCIMQSVFQHTSTVVLPRSAYIVHWYILYWGSQKWKKWRKDGKIAVTK